jgi:hypothetical protein
MVSVLFVLLAFILIILLLGHGKYRVHILIGFVVLAFLVYLLTGIPDFDQGGGLD